MNRTKKAYLIVICDPITNAIKRTEIWSSPEWEQSLCLKERTFIAYEVEEETYAEARKLMIFAISIPSCRYHYLYKLLDPRELE